MEFLFILLFAYLQKMRSARIRKAADAAAAKAKGALPVTLK
jgi:hypothetical protein